MRIRRMDEGLGGKSGLEGHKLSYSYSSPLYNQIRANNMYSTPQMD